MTAPFFASVAPQHKLRLTNGEIVEDIYILKEWAPEDAAEVWAEALAQGTRGVEEPIGMAPIGSTGPTGTPHSSTRHFKAFSRTLWSAPISTTGIRVRSERCAGQEM